ncbi:MAG: galactokinase [Calditrichaceae bacterium]|nr:galactokinase [Calditrichaceae bacterium]
MSLHLQNYKQIFEKLFDNDIQRINYQISRFNKLEKMFIKYFNEQDMRYFSAPGRVEIGGNHTDHNHGRVLAAAINLDIIAIASPTQNNIVTIYSEGYSEPFIVDLEDKKVNNKEIGTTNALIRGVAARMDDLGDTIGGFNAVITSDVPMGSGISSSASIEVLLGSIYNHLHNGGARASEMIAQIGQYAENVYFGKPCGLMDQIACAVGGIIAIDFENPAIPLITRLDSSFSTYNYSLLLVDTGDNHADLTQEYAAIPEEMQAVAEAMGARTCRDIDKNSLIKNIPGLRKTTGDRAILRALHFLDENDRVKNQILALEMGDFDRFLAYVKDSGNSSFKWLQNIYTARDKGSQNITLALALTEQFIDKIKKGACRIHGGGFAGTILALIPKEYVDQYCFLMRPVFGEDCVIKLYIRQTGAIYINKVFK